MAKVKHVNSNKTPSANQAANDNDKSQHQTDENKQIGSEELNDLGALVITAILSTRDDQKLTQAEIREVMNLLRLGSSIKIVQTAAVAKTKTAEAAEHRSE